jgi:hypothetical protein
LVVLILLVSEDEKAMIDRDSWGHQSIKVTNSCSKVKTKVFETKDLLLKDATRQFKFSTATGDGSKTTLSYNGRAGRSACLAGLVAGRRVLFGAEEFN